MNTNDNCDGAGPHTQGEARSLPIGHGNVILCQKCWTREMKWRKRMNAEFMREHPGHFASLMFRVYSWMPFEEDEPQPDVAQEAARMRRRNAKTIGL